ncbi:MAG: ABC-F family ATP-binding cassette domain-containing protein [Planctomycetota bacterium]
MSLLSIDGLKKHFGAQEILRGASTKIDPGEKVGMVGRNGGGKTTLFRIIAGEEVPDWGSVTLRRGARLGVVPQRPVFHPGVTVREYVAGGLSEVRQAIQEYEDCTHRMGHAEGEDLERAMRDHDRLSSRIEELGGWETERRVEVVLGGIGLVEQFWDREAATLSGGEKNRVALARELVAGHDILLLDEPTNHLDLEGIEWLERYLKDLHTAILVVSHDRRLLTNCVSRIIELERGEIVSYTGNYPKYITLKQERYESELRAFEQQQDMLRKEKAFIDKHMGSQRTAEAKGRQKRLERVEKLEKPNHDVRRPVIRAPKAARGGEEVLKAEGVSGGYGDKVLFKDVDLRIGRGQRIGIVGPNGAGKSTFLKLIAGKLDPMSGIVERGHGAVCAYYDQDTSHLRGDHTAAEELRRHYPAMTDQQVRDHLARFLFRGDEIEKLVSLLSGGERARLSLSILVLSEPSWFALDEPTNHLDLASRTALEEMLGEFQGAIICISHDRAFLDGITNTTYEVGGGTVREFEGNYSAWRATKEAESSAASDERQKREAAARRAAVEAEAKRQQQAAQQQQQKGAPKSTSGKRKNPRNPFKLEQLEQRIMKLEEELKKLHDSLVTEAVYKDAAKLRDTQFRIAELEMELEAANEEWINWDA